MSELYFYTITKFNKKKVHNILNKYFIFNLNSPLNKGKNAWYNTDEKTNRKIKLNIIGKKLPKYDVKVILDIFNNSKKIDIQLPIQSVNTMMQNMKVTVSNIQSVIKNMNVNVPNLQQAIKNINANIPNLQNILSTKYDRDFDRYKKLVLIENIINKK